MCEKQQCSCKQKKPHVHAKLIKAWADGAEIEFFRASSGTWEYIAEPGWYAGSQYRIKPEPKPDIVLYAVASAGWFETNLGHPRSIWSKQRGKEDTIKATFDGETKELKSVEMLKYYSCP